MKKFYYVCPRCGRQWKRFVPRSKMRCRFCSEEWKTRGRRGTRSRFSWTATFLWLFWILVVAAVVVKFQTILGAVSNTFKGQEPAVVQAPAEPGKEAETSKPKKKVPPIQFRTLDEIEQQKAGANQKPESAGTPAATSDPETQTAPETTVAEPANADDAILLPDESDPADALLDSLELTDDPDTAL